MKFLSSERLMGQFETQCKFNLEVPIINQVTLGAKIIRYVRTKISQPLKQL